MRLLSIVLVAAFSVVSVQGQQHKVVMVSIDGLRGVELASLPNPHWHVPNLDEIVTKGAVSEGMLSVLPSITYPNHTSMVTGVSPATHGILSNYLFDPQHTLAPADGWDEYAAQIRVPTLWTVAHEAGLRTAGVYWPVTVGAAMDDNMPEHYPMQTDRDLLLYQALCTHGLLAEYEQANGKLPLGEGYDDHTRAQMAAFLIQAKKPDLLFVHFVELDHAEHMSGPDSPEAIRALESIDSYVGMLRKTVAAAGLANQTDFVIVSDHGFFPISQSLHPEAVLASMGLLGTKDHPEKWRVAAFGGGGSFGLVAHDPNDHEAITLAANTFKRLQQEGSWGIDQILEGEQLKAAKGFSNCFMVIGMKSGFWGDGGDSGSWLTPSRFKGMHGYIPGPRNMDSSFAVFGPGIPHLRLPRGHIVDVAPTVAGLLGLRMTGIEGTNILPAGGEEKVSRAGR
jgi:predicted AlkP superfamily pyrophosphatase or phosphodiesterase